MKNLEMKSRESMLNALADGELDAAEQEEMLDRLDQDEALRNEFCDIRRIKDLVRYAYPLDEMPGDRRSPGRSPGVFSRAAGVLALVLSGFIGGWLLAPQHGEEQEAFRLADVQPDAMKVVLYLGDSDPAKFQKTLKTAEKLLKRYEQNGTEVYVVTSAGGVDLLRKATTSVAADISALKDRYASLHFVACNNTLFNLKKKGKPVQLVEEAEVAPSAVSFVVSRLKQGWTYMAI